MVPVRVPVRVGVDVGVVVGVQVVSRSWYGVRVGVPVRVQVGVHSILQFFRHWWRLLKDVANRTVQAVRLDSSLLMVKTIAILIDNFFSSQGKMSQEHDSSDEGSIEGSVPVPDNGQIGEKRGRPLGKKKKRPACHPSFRAPGPPTAEGWGFILGYASSSTVHWSLRDLAAIFNISVSTLQGGLAWIPGGYTQNIEKPDYVAVLEENFLPCFKRHQQRYPSTKFLLIQDGCRIHTTDEALEAIRSWGMDVLDRKVWPPHSPDLNVIENLWGYAKHAVNKELSGDLSASVEAKRKLEREILKMWRSHPTADVNNLVASFPRRLKAVVDLKGEYTKY